MDSAIGELGGAYTAMVTMTAGEAGTQVAVVARQQNLGVVRTAEALKNSFHLGVDEHEVWDYPDGGVPAPSTRGKDPTKRRRPLSARRQ